MLHNMKYLSPNPILSFKRLRTDTHEYLKRVLSFVEQNYIRKEAFISNNYVFIDGRGMPIFAFLYVLMRNGMVQLISELCTQYEGERHIMEILDRFNEIFQDYIRDGKETLSPEYRRAALNQLTQWRDTLDVFGQALYILLIRLDEIASDELISTRLGDYLWYQLKLCSFEGDLFISQDSNAPTQLNSSISLFELRANILSRGSDYFNPGNVNPLNYIKVLIFTLSYDHAFEFMRRNPTFLNDLVHLLIVFKESGLLRELDAGFSILAEENDRQAYLSVADLFNDVIKEYVSGFGSVNPIEALSYIRLLPQKELVELTSEIIMNHSHMALFFANTTEAERNDRRLRELYGYDNYNQLIRRLVKANARASPEVSIRLLEKIGDYGIILQIIIEEEMENIESLKSRGGIDFGLRSSNEKFCQDIANKYRNSGVLENFPREAEILNIFKYVRVLHSHLSRKTYEEGLKTMRDSRLLPTREEDNLAYREKFIKYDASIKRAYLELLLVSFKILKEHCSLISSKMVRVDKNYDHLYKSMRIMLEALRSFYQDLQRGLVGDQSVLGEIMRGIDEEIKQLTIIPLP
eukprot:TRINITY_DN6491_c0_g2_i11.p1 TRINITY_DN6491_c0_g2~~TRINITY_DN6491_c0_g2_i11.p1  ORF type:complete len:579 (+),score=120.18 TRINITY_DN6491_c0_g2_i11:790-2526(+)